MSTVVHAAFVRAMRKRVAASRSGRRRPPRARLPYPVLIVYSDVPAARQAMGRLGASLSSASDRELQPMLWPFSQLEHARWRETALRDAARALTIVLALGPQATLTPGVEAWLTALTARHRGATISALAFVGDDAWTISLQQTQPAAAKIHGVATAAAASPCAVPTACAARAA